MTWPPSTFSLCVVTWMPQVRVWWECQGHHGLQEALPKEPWSLGRSGTWAGLYAETRASTCLRSSSKVNLQCANAICQERTY